MIEYFSEYNKDKNILEQFRKRQIIEKGLYRNEHFLEFCNNLELVNLFFELNESKGTIQIEKFKNEYQDISDKIDHIINDVNRIYYDENFAKSYFDRNREKYKDYVDNVNLCNIYVLNYTNIFNWFLNLKILIADSEYVDMPNGNAYIDNLELSCYIKDKILYGTIFIGNPFNNLDLKSTIYHELHHYYSAFKKYQSNSYFIKNDFALKQSYKYPNYDFNDYELTINQLLFNDGAKYLEQIIFNCFYYLNQNEIEARQENIYNELKCGKSNTLEIYNNIYKVINYLLENNLECEHKILNNEILMKRIKKVFGIPPEIKKTSLKFVYKKFIKKYEYLMKHVNAMKEFLNIN